MIDPNYATLDDDDYSLFRARTDTYSSLERTHTGNHNLAETIEDGTITENAYHATIPLRRAANDQVYPYDTVMIYNWFQRSTTDPNTREDMSYTVKRVNAKKKWLDIFPDITTNMVTRQFKRDILLSWLKKRETHAGINFLTKDLHEKARAFIDVSTLEHSGHFIVSSAEEAKEILPVFSAENQSPVWMIRKSSKHHEVMPNSEVFTISYFIPGTTRVRHERYTYVHGAGIYRGPAYKSFKELSENRSQVPDFVCVIDVLFKFVKQGFSPKNLYTLVYE